MKLMVYLKTWWGVWIFTMFLYVLMNFSVGYFYNIGSNIIFIQTTIFGIFWLAVTYNMRNYMKQKGGRILGKWYIFLLDSNLRSELSKGSVSDELRDYFEKLGHPLSWNAEIIDETERSWVIKDDSEVYLIKDHHDLLSVEWKNDV